MGVDRKTLRELRDGTWPSVDDLREYVERVVPLGRRDVEKMLEVLLDPKIERYGALHKNRCTIFRAAVLRSADPSLFAPLAKSIAPGDPLLRAVIQELLPKVNDVDGHGALSEALGDNDPRVRAIASAVLVEIGGPSSLKDLARRVRAAGFAGRKEALEIFVPKARHRAMDLIRGVVRAGTTPERILALKYLGDPELMGAAVDQAIAAIIEALDDKDSRVAAAAFESFAALADEERFLDALAPKIHTSDVSPVLVEALGNVASRRSVELLRARLRYGPSAVQLAIVRALDKISNDDVVEPLVDALHLPDGPVHRAASEALHRLGDKDGIDLARLLVQLLKSPRSEVRRAATQIASTVKTPSEELTAQLLKALREESWWVRERVLDALVEMDVGGLALELIAYLDDPNPVIRRYALYGLLRLRDPATLGTLLKCAVTDDDWWVREQALQAVAELRDPRAIAYIEATIEHRPDLRVAGLEALMTIGAEDSLLARADLTSDDDPSVRYTILSCLGTLERGREASFYVQACREDKDASVAKLARELLERWKISESDHDSASVGLLGRLLVAAARRNADDVLLAPGRSPYVKHHGHVEPISKGVLNADEMERMLLPILSVAQRKALADGEDVDLSYEVPGFGLRFRINVFRERHGLAAVFRRISGNVPHLDALGLPDIIKGFADYPNGLVLVGGPTGSGKSTTLAALIGYINQHHGEHIVTIEDPIEVLHPKLESLINQREVGTHATSFAQALRAVLRQDPDVLLVGELRDRETIEFAVNAAETGHLVFATVHTTSAATSIDRMIHALPAARQPLIRSMLAESLRAVVCQQLLRRIDEPDKRVLACEIMINNAAVSNLIRKDKSFQLPSVIRTHSDIGMQLMDDHLMSLVTGGIVGPDAALLKALDKNAFREFLDAHEATAEARGIRRADEETTSAVAAPSPMASGSQPRPSVTSETGG
ncbi:MAG: PilT/PilU family type 4a pilus ATPase [Sandaracinaceae bacterium]